MPLLHDEQTLTQRVLWWILLSADKKTRVACVLVAHSGLRLMTFGNYSGTDGLRIKKLPRLQEN